MYIFSRHTAQLSVLHFIAVVIAVLQGEQCVRQSDNMAVVDLLRSRTATDIWPLDESPYPQYVTNLLITQIPDWILPAKAALDLLVQATLTKELQHQPNQYIAQDGVSIKILPHLLSSSTTSHKA